MERSAFATFGRAIAAATAFAVVVAGGWFDVGRPATAAAATDPTTVTGDPLPTVQVNGVVWSQTVVGTTVYAAGNFTSARPAGSAPGTDEVPRTHLLAYDIRTGVLDPSFAPVLNGQALSIAASPDGSRIYVVGDFTSVNGAGRWRVAAFSTATGSLVGAFAPNAGTTVRAVAATNTAVFLGGDFLTMNNTARPYIAAVAASNGALLPFNPAPDAPVNALTMNPSASSVVVGGRFTVIGGAEA